MRVGEIAERKRARPHRIYIASRCKNSGWRCGRIEADRERPRCTYSETGYEEVGTCVDRFHRVGGLPRDGVSIRRDSNEQEEQSKSSHACSHARWLTSNAQSEAEPR